MTIDTEEELSTITIEDILFTKKLILWNDDVTSFDTVIKALCSVLSYDSIRAEQVALIVHNNGKYCLKTGSSEELQIIYDKLSDFGLTLEIQ